MAYVYDVPFYRIDGEPPGCILVGEPFQRNGISGNNYHYHGVYGQTSTIRCYGAWTDDSGRNQAIDRCFQLSGTTVTIIDDFGVSRYYNHIDGVKIISRNNVQGAIASGTAYNYLACIEFQLTNMGTIQGG